MTSAVLVERLAQRRDMDVDVALFDDTAGPQPCHKLVLANDLAFRCGQRAQNVERAAVQPHQHLIAPQFAPAEAEPETAEADLLVLHQIKPKIVRGS
jgi:hypothetical protein